MRLLLKIIEGPLKGHKFALKVGLAIGRTKGDIRIDDKKVSSLHAFVTETDGEFILNDNGSKNGIRVEGEKATTVPLRNGTTFQIGNAVLQVVLARERASTPRPTLPEEVPLPEGPSAENTSTAVPLDASTPTATPAPQERRWNEVLAQFTDQVLAELQDQPKALAALNPAVKLTFLGGIQAETEWVLGYGPRRIGPHSVDLPIFEPNVPEVCFEILPSPEGVTFRTNHPNDVTLNGQPIRIKPLAVGDIIVVGETRIEVDLVP